MSAIRLRKNGVLKRPTVNTSTGQLSTVGVDGTAVKVAFWTRKLQAVIGSVGEVDRVDALGFLPAGTDVKRRDQLTVNSRVYTVMQVISADDDTGREDHIGVQLQETGAA